MTNTTLRSMPSAELRKKLLRIVKGSRQRRKMEVNGYIKALRLPSLVFRELHDAVIEANIGEVEIVREFADLRFTKSVAAAIARERETEDTPMANAVVATLRELNDNTGGVGLVKEKLDNVPGIFACHTLEHSGIDVSVFILSRANAPQTVLAVGRRHRR